MNIAFIARRYDTTGGTERDLYELTRRLSNRGHDVHIYCQEVRTEPPSGIKIHKVPAIGIGRSARLWGLACLGPWMAYRGSHDIVVSFARVIRQDIVRCGGGSHRVYLQRISEAEGTLKRGFKAFSPYHNSLLYIEKRQFEKNSYRKVLAISEVVKREIMQVFGVSEGDIEVIYDGIDTTLFNSGNRKLYRDEVRKELGIPSDASLVLFLGNGFKRKGLDLLIGSLDLLNDESPFCLVVGSDNAKDAYREKADRLGIGKKLIFAGQRREPQRFYAAADIFVLPSLQEAFGNAVLEAMASGLPVITTRRAGASEIMRDGLERYILDDPLSSERLAQMIRELLDPEVRERIGTSARGIAEGYTLDKNARAIEGLCRRVLEEKICRGI